MRDPSGVNEKPPPVAVAIDPKGKAPAQETPAEADTDTPLPFTQESEVLVEKMYSDDKSKLKSLA
jgi:hypothetical protein